jgi:hypothetical protein
MPDCAISTIVFTCDSIDYNVSCEDEESIGILFEEPAEIFVTLALPCGSGSGDGLQLGETSLTAYRGDRGKIAYDHSQITGTPHVQQWEKDFWNSNAQVQLHELEYNHDEFVSSLEVDTIKVLTAAAYAALNPKDSRTMYVIVN